jgi:hypothetical protein
MAHVSVTINMQENIFLLNLQKLICTVIYKSLKKNQFHDWEGETYQGDTFVRGPNEKNNRAVLLGGGDPGWWFGMKGTDGAKSGETIVRGPKVGKFAFRGFDGVRGELGPAWRGVLGGVHGSSWRSVLGMVTGIVLTEAMCKLGK